MPQKETQRDSKREMDLACPRREGPCEAEEWSLSRLGQPQMTARKLGPQTYNTWALHFVYNMNLEGRVFPQSLWRRVHPSNTDFSLVTLENPAESSWPSAYRTTRWWRTGVVSSHQAWGNKLQAAVEHQHDTPRHQGQTMNTLGRQSIPVPPPFTSKLTLQEIDWVQRTAGKSNAGQGTEQGAPHGPTEGAAGSEQSSPERARERLSPDKS